MLREAVGRPPVDREAPAGAVGREARTVLHASCVALSGAGVVLLGPSGCGKSDLALRLIDAGGRLVADDCLVVERRGNRLIGRPAENVAGLIEVRGLGIMRLEHCSSTPLALVVALGAPEARLPERMTHDLLCVALPCVRLDPHAPSTCAKIRLALGAERVE
jgi:serine kinase of HPr protein (carbohydrate metabolism regulator)